MEIERVRANCTANRYQPPLSLSRRIHVDAEISVFDAERYFNEGGGGDDALGKEKEKKTTPSGAGIVGGSSANPRDSSLDGGCVGRSYFPTGRSFGATPTGSSEESWNSQTGLLANPPGSAVGVSVRACNSFNESNRKGSTSTTTTTTSSTSSFRGRRFFGRHCACYSKRSVEVEDKFGETSSSIPIRSQSHHSSNAGESFPKPVDEATEMTKLRISATEPGPYSLPAADIGRRIVNSGGGGGFSFPLLISPGTAPPPAKALEEPLRASLEVFRPSTGLARILRKSTSAPMRVADDDVACDGAGSDLFELESCSAPSSSAYRRRRRDASLRELRKLATVAAGAGARQFGPRSLEELVAPSECDYAPSEASVEWSVTTARGGFERTSSAGFSSAASEDGGKVRPAQTGKERFGSAATPARNEAVKKRGGDGGLLNCGCEKAVNVGPEPVRFVPDPQRLHVAAPS